MKARITRLATAGFSAAALLLFTVPLGAQAAPLVPATAEGDSYAVSAVAALLGGNPIFVGPVARSYSTVPPGVTAANQTGVVVSGPAGPLNPVVSSLNVANDTSKASLVPVASTDCTPTQADQDGYNGPFAGGNACTEIANANLLNTGGDTVQTAMPQITATAVFAQSVTLQCDPTQGLPFGSADLVDLSIGGQQLAGTINKTRDDTGQIPVNTEIDVLSPGATKIATVILNEQHLDNKSGGQGLTVNAIHVIVGPLLDALVHADVIIGHAHSSAACTTPPSKQPCDVAGNTDPRCHGVIIKKTDDTGTETAKPGQTITYTVVIDPKTNSGSETDCVVNQVTDTLPPGFSYVSSSGGLGNNPTVAGSQITWFNATGFTETAGKITETVVAKIAANETDGFFSNFVETLSSCGQNEGSSPPIHVIVTPPTVVVTAPPPSSGTQAATTSKLPFTGTMSPDSSIWLGVILLGLVVSAVAATRVLREGPID